MLASCKIQDDEQMKTSLLGKLTSLEDLCSDPEIQQKLKRNIPSNTKNAYVSEYLKWVEKSSLLIALEQYFLSHPIFEESDYIGKRQIIDAFYVDSPSCRNQDLI